MEYKTVKDYGEDFFIEKKSRFIGYCMPVTTEEDAKFFINEIKLKHKDATHNVSAYVLRENNIERFNDDGEPSGTAGIPMLETIKKSGVKDVVLVGTRYFGGIMLGGGGLVRAYSHTASIALKSAKICVMKECILASAKCHYSYYTKLQEILSKAEIDDTLFEDMVTVKFHILQEDLIEFRENFSELTKGNGIIDEIGKNFYSFEI